MASFVQGLLNPPPPQSRIMEELEAIWVGETEKKPESHGKQGKPLVLALVLLAFILALV